MNFVEWKKHLIRETGAQAISCRVVRVDTSIVESYGLYEWTQVLSSGKMHLITKGDRGPSNQLSSRTSRTSAWTQVLSSRQRMLSSGKCISLGRQGPRQSVVESYESFEWTQALSSRTGCTSGQKHCRVDNEFCRVEKCISLCTQGPKQSVVETNTDSTKTVTVILH